MEWTRERVADQLAEAADTLRRLPEEDRRWRAGMRSHWPEVVRTAAELRGESAPRGRPASPTPGAIDRLDRTLDWLGWLTEPQRRIAWALAVGVRPTVLARRIGCHRNTVANRHAQALDAICARLAQTGEAAINPAGRTG